ncbi:MAG: hypothetical protein Q9203_006988, partial [Teloschistes exilis]
NPGNQEASSRLWPHGWQSHRPMFLEENEEASSTRRRGAVCIVAEAFSDNVRIYCRWPRRKHTIEEAGATGQTYLSRGLLEAIKHQSPHVYPFSPPFRRLRPTPAHLHASSSPDQPFLKPRRPSPIQVLGWIRDRFQPNRPPLHPLRHRRNPHPISNLPPPRPPPRRPQLLQNRRSRLPSHLPPHPFRRPPAHPANPTIRHPSNHAPQMLRGHLRLSLHHHLADEQR